MIGHQWREAGSVPDNFYRAHRHGHLEQVANELHGPRLALEIPEASMRSYPESSGTPGIRARSFRPTWSTRFTADRVMR